jgi:drug/metabolite transporter (DMT)-like permease
MTKAEPDRTRSKRVSLATPTGAHGTLLGTALVLIAAAVWAFGSFGATRVPLPADVLLSASWQMIWGSAVAGAVGVAAGEHLSFAEISGRSWAALWYLAIASSGVAFTAYSWMLQHAPVSQATTWGYISPVIAVFAGALVLGEPVGHATLAGTVLIALSVAATLRAESPRTRTT